MALVQFVFLRTDVPALGRGALVAQACHASIAAIAVHSASPDTQRYLRDLAQMTTVVLRMDAAQCASLVQFLAAAGYDHHAWTEQPEGVVTCVALRPYDRTACSDLLGFARGFRLY